MDPRSRLFGSFALLGTARRSPSFSEAEFPSGSLIRDIADASDGSPEGHARALLRGAGALQLCDRAGYLPVTDETLSEIPGLSPEESRVMLPEDSPVTGLCGEIFRSGPFRLQWEVLSYLQKRDMVLPHSLLTQALAMGRSVPGLRPLLFQSVGARGLWLASLNPDWRMFASTSSAEPELETWEHGRPMQRQAFFLAARASRPAWAREIFEADLASMDASERNTLLSLFERGLDAEDEELLERLLKKDRSREVRKTAAFLLSRLSGSRYVQRMEARLASCVETFGSAPASSLISGLRRVAAALGRGKGEADFVTPPESYDPSWAEDGISEKSPFSQFGPRAGWLYQMAVAVPLSWWSEHTGRTLDELLELSKRSAWKTPLQTAWGDALLRSGDEQWARAVLKAMKEGSVWPSSSHDSLDRFRLAGMLGEKERESVWEGMLSADSLPELLQDIHSRQEPGYRMSASLAIKAVVAMRDRLSSTRSRDYVFASVVEELAMVLPLNALENAQRMLDALPDTPQTEGVRERFSAVARQRLSLGAYFS